MIKGFFIFLLLFSSSANALVGTESLTIKLFEQSPELSSLRKNVESKEALYLSGLSGYLPSLNAVGGWQQNKTDATPTEKGTIGYLEGRYNLFNGFRDSSIRDQKQAELSLAKIELELKQRDLKISLTEVLSDMLYLHRLQDILAEEYKVVQTQKKIAQKKMNAGLTGAVDNLEFNLRESEIQIEQNQISQLHDETHQNLIKLFGTDLSDSDFVEIKYQDQTELAQVGRTFERTKNLEYQLAVLNLSKATYAKSEIRSDFLPKLDLTASIGRLTPSENTPTQFNESKYGVTLIIPLFSGLDTYHKIKSSNFSISSAEKVLIQKGNDITAEYNIIKNKISELDKLYKINEQRLQTAQSYFDLTLGEYRRGIKNSPDLVGATERLFSTKKKQIEIVKNLEILKIKIDNL